MVIDGMIALYAVGVDGGDVPGGRVTVHLLHAADRGFYATYFPELSG